MLYFNSSRALLQGMFAGAFVLASASACSRSDRSETGQDNTATVIPDTSAAIGSDTAAHAGTHGAAVTDTANDTATAPAPTSAPRAATAPPSAERQDASLERDSAAGYRAMGADTASVPESDSARVTEDTSGIDTTAQSINLDTATAGHVEMARDTSTTADQIDTTGRAADADGAIRASIDTSHDDTLVTSEAAPSGGDVDMAVTADTAGNAGRIRPPEDSTEILGHVTGDTTGAVATADTAESERIRPPEDSTELAGVYSAETADEEPVDAASREIAGEEPETVASESRSDEVGAAAISGDITGTEAVTVMSRQGARCIVVDPEVDEEFRWDMSRTPVTINPCGLGAMNLSKVETAGSERQN